MASDNSGTVHPMGVDGYGTGKHVDHSRGVAFGDRPSGNSDRHTDTTRDAK